MGGTETKLKLFSYQLKRPSIKALLKYIVLNFVAGIHRIYAGYPIQLNGMIITVTRCDGEIYRSFWNIYIKDKRAVNFLLIFSQQILYL